MKNLSLITSLLFCHLSFTQQTYVPDDGFEQALIFEGLDTVLDDSVATNIIDTLQTLDLSPFSIVDLTGIEDFAELKHFVCRNNSIVNLNLSNNTELRFVNCENNAITSINVQNCPLLAELNADNNNLVALDVSQNTLLERLNVHANNIPSFDFTPNPALIEFIAGNSGLQSLIFGNNTALETLDVSTNSLTSLNLTNLPSLTSLLIFSNQLTSIDLTANTVLSIFFGHNNLFNALNFENNTLLTYISCYHSPVENITLPNIDTTSQQVVNFVAHENPNLTCIQTDFPTYISTVWNNAIDSTAFFATNCTLGLSIVTPDFTVFPNPVSNGQLTIQFEDDYTYTLYNISGQLIDNGRKVNGATNVQTHHLPKGFYIIELQTKTTSITKKIQVN